MFPTRVVKRTTDTQLRMAALSARCESYKILLEMMMRQLSAYEALAPVGVQKPALEAFKERLMLADVNQAKLDTLKPLMLTEEEYELVVKTLRKQVMEGMTGLWWRGHVGPAWSTTSGVIDKLKKLRGLVPQKS